MTEDEWEEVMVFMEAGISGRTESQEYADRMTAYYNGEDDY